MVLLLLFITINYIYPYFLLSASLKYIRLKNQTLIGNKRNKTDIQRDLDIQTYKVELLSKKINIMQYVEKVANTCVTNFD